MKKYPFTFSFGLLQDSLEKQLDRQGFYLALTLFDFRSKLKGIKLRIRAVNVLYAAGDLLDKSTDRACARILKDLAPMVFKKSVNGK